MRQSERRNSKYKKQGAAILAAILLIMAAVAVKAQRITPTGVNAPALPYSVVPVPANPADTIMMPFPVQQTVPQRYEDLMEDEMAMDLSTPSNIRTEAEFDPATGIMWCAPKSVTMR